MAHETTVVTPQRYTEGFAYADYIDQINVNKARFQEFYEKFQVTETEAESLKELVANPKGPSKMMVIGEDWCGDVVRGLPVLARMAEVSGMEIRIFPRDSHEDIMSEYLKEGKYMSIPVAVFYTNDHQYLCHWIERPEVAAKEQSVIEQAIRSENPGINDQDFGRERRSRTGAKAEDWQRATVTEIIKLLHTCVG
ncbi:MAG: thioredoxin family protein [Chloroflexota bacterium]|nr:thioredoxin family protein [Chloroflexota bacterium]